MKTLILIRHASTNVFDEGVEDHEKSINHHGKEELNFLANWIKDTSLQLDIIYSSSALRAISTSKALFNNNDKIVNNKALYLCDYLEIINLLKSLDTGINEVAIVGHEPSISETLNYLVGDFRPDLKDILAKPYPTGGLSVINLNIDNWSQINKKSGIFDAFINPNSPKNSE